MMTTTDRLAQLIKKLNKSWRKDAKKAVAYLQRLLASGMKFEEALDNVQRHYGKLFTLPELKPALVEAAAYAYGIVPTMLTKAQVESMGEELADKWDESGMTLSEKLHGVGVKMRSAIVSTLQEQMRRNKTWTEAARALYDGYGDDGQNVYNGGKDIISRQELPKYLQKVREATGNDLQALAEQRQAIDKINRLAKNGAPNKALQAAYNKLLEAVQKGNEKAIEKAVEVAVNEKSRYVAERITRTEMARAWADGFIAKMQKDADIVAVKFKLSSRHPVFDICDMYAKADMYGLGAGIYPKDKLPPLPVHPHCLCRYVEVIEGEVDMQQQRDQVQEAGNKWLNSLPESRRAQVLGRKGLKAWEDGEDWRKYMRGFSGFREAESRLQTFERSYSHGVGSPVCNLEYINSTDYKRKFDALSDNRTLNRAVYERCKAMLIHQSGKYSEDLCIMTADGKQLVGLTTNSEDGLTKYTDKLKEEIKKHRRNTLISIHNHATNIPPTGADFATAGYRGYKFGVVACHNGRVYIYSTENALPFSATGYDKMVAKYQDVPYNLDSEKAILKTMEIFSKSHGIMWRELK